MGKIRKERNIKPAEASFGSGGVHPGQVGEVRVNTTSYNLNIIMVLIYVFLTINNKKNKLYFSNAKCP